MRPWPTDAERRTAEEPRSIYADEQVQRAIAKVVNEVPDALVSRAHIADLTLRTVAPFVADREAAAEKRGRVAALRKAQHAWQTGDWTTLTEAAKRPRQVQRILGTAQAVTEWLRDRADALEADQ